MHIPGAAKTRSATTVRVFVWLSVLILHGAALAGLAANATEPAVMIGGAPVIQLTLAPRASFDGVNAPQTSASSTAPSRRTDDSPAPQPVAAPLEPPTIRRPLHAAPHTTSLAAAEQEPAPSAPSRHTPGSGAASTGEARRASEAGLTEGGGAPVVGAGAASTADAYEAAVLAWIERHKQHPGGPAGIVTVRFTLDRRGALRASEVLSSSGMSSVDHAALSQLKDAAPFPRPAAHTLWRTRDFVVRIDFRSLRAPR